MTSEPYFETKFYHLEGYFNFGTTVDSVVIPSLEALKGTYGFPEAEASLVADADAGGTIELAGFAFIPDRVITSETATQKKFYTQGIKVVLVGIASGGTGTGTNALSVYPPMESSAVITVPTTKSDEVNVESPFAIFSNIAKWGEFTFHYNGSVEFDLAFLDLATFEHFSTHNGFYNDQQKGETDFATSRGIHFSRAVVDIVPNGETKLRRFRTLNFAPHPIPDALLDSMGREDIAYYLGPTCPPLWYDTLTTEATVAGLAAVNSSIAPEKKITQPPLSEKDPVAKSTGDGRVSLQDLFVALREGGYIKEHQRVNIWPVILIRLLIWVVLITGAVWGISRLVK